MTTPKDRWDEQAAKVSADASCDCTDGHCGADEGVIAAALRSADATGYARGREEMEHQAAVPVRAESGVSDCGHNRYWTTHFGSCLWCRLEQAEARAASAPAISPVQPEEKPCVCHSGSVCGEACRKGVCHGGCAGDTPSEQIRNEQGEGH
jgi:hypothetical protein